MHPPKREKFNSLDDPLGPTFWHIISIRMSFSLENMSKTHLWSKKVGWVSLKCLASSRIKA